MPVESVHEPAPNSSPYEDDDGVVLELHDRCARPRCRAEFLRSAGRGRRKQYCTDICRGIAEKEYKQAKATVTHYERLVRDARYDLAAFGRTGDDVVLPTTPEDQDAAVVAASNEWRQALGAVQFARPGDEQILDVLRRLVVAVGPVLNPRA
jgi:hypothetical protein